jgi:hypothetical protein
MYTSRGARRGRSPGDVAMVDDGWGHATSSSWVADDMVNLMSLL